MIDSFRAGEIPTAKGLEKISKDLLLIAQKSRSQDALAKQL
jgi:hypothetical protein